MDLDRKRPLPSTLPSRISCNSRSSAKDDWRARVRALDKLTTSLRQPEVARFVSVSSKHAGLSLLLFLLKVLHDDRSQRVACSSLRALRALVQALPVSHLLHELPSVVPGVCRHLGGGASVAVKLEAVEAVKTLMRTVRPAPIIEVLFSDKCFGSKSSRLRENSLLCLLYALMTFPSTEFPVGQLARRIMSAAVSEPRRRVRQAVLEALAALAQFIPSSLLRLDPHDYPPLQRTDVDHFNRAVQSRLLRKVLPSISPDGLILYSLHIPINPDHYSSNQNRDLDNGNMPAASFSIKSVSGQERERGCGWRCHIPNPVLRPVISGNFTGTSPHICLKGPCQQMMAVPAEYFFRSPPKLSTALYLPIILNTTADHCLSRSSGGADADWVMAGTGVLSSGSARSRNQLDNAQRAFNSPTEQSADRYPNHHGFRLVNVD
ncbi:hypothetical protein J6590_006392 [Homalodisca vitripennis]|nr:hypothetical protein J6590_006392 [Homalodisca vitripennis]